MNKRGLNPNSKANLKKTAGPGRPKMTIEDRIMKKYCADYLENGEAIKDFERLRGENPGKALEMALDRVYGKATQEIEMTGSVTLEQVRANLLGMIIECKKEEDGKELNQEY